MILQAWMPAAESERFRRSALPAFARALSVPGNGPSVRQLRLLLPTALRPSLFGAD